MKKSCVVNDWWWNWLVSCRTTLGLLNTYISCIVQVVSADGGASVHGVPMSEIPSPAWSRSPMMKANMCFDIKHKHVDAAEMENKLNGLLFTLIRKMVPMNHHGPPETRPEKDNNCDVYITSHTCCKSVLPWGCMLKSLGEKCFAFSNSMRKALANLILGGTSVAV